MDGFRIDNREKIIWKQTTPHRIEQIIYSPSYTFDYYIDHRGRLASGAKIKVDTKLSILLADRKFVEFSLQKLNNQTVEITEADLWWLGNEICDFLGLELQVISQTPVIPRAGS